MEVREVIVHIRRGLNVSIRAGCRTVCDHPVIFGLVAFMILLHRFFPAFFSFLVSSAPVVICTAFLLGMLLSYGEPISPELEGEYKMRHDISSKSTRASQDKVVNQEEIFVEGKRGVEHVMVKELDLCEEAASDGSQEDTQVFTPTESEEEEGEEEEEEDDDDSVAAARPLLKDFKNDIYAESKVSDMRQSSETVHMREFSEEMLAEGVLTVDHEVADSFKCLNEPLIHDFGINAPPPGEFRHSYLAPLHPTDGHDSSSDSESDRSESLSPDASMADIIPMLDEFHPLLNISDAHRSVQDSDSDDGSADEIGNQEDEEDDEGHDDKEDQGPEVALGWTADDQKNLMDLGTSEMERNQRLENLIARRRARKNLEFERKLIDLDSANTAPFMEHLSHLLVQIPPISVQRQNPFDHPYDKEGAIPGSAPSVLQPRRNPFDFSYDDINGSEIFGGDKSHHEESIAPPLRDMFFRRHESFHVGSSASVEMKVRRHTSRLGPYFIPERLDAEECDFGVLQRQSSEISDSNMNSVVESESLSVLSVSDHEDHKEDDEQIAHHQGKLSSLNSHVSEDIVLESHSSHELDHVIPGEAPLGDDTDLVQQSNLNASAVIEEHHHAAAILGITQESLQLDLPKQVTSLEAIVERYDDRSSSLQNEINSQMPIYEGQQEREDFYFPTPEVDGIGGNLAGDPIFDYSPSQSHVATVDEPLISLDHNESFLNSSEPDMQNEASKTGLSTIPSGRNIDTRNGDLFSVSGSRSEPSTSSVEELWVAMTNLSCLHENESKPNKGTEGREAGATGAAFSNVREPSHQPQGDGIRSDLTFHSENLVLYDSSASSIEPNEYVSLINLGPGFGIKISQGSILNLSTVAEEPSPRIPVVGVVFDSNGSNNFYDQSENVAVSPMMFVDSDDVTHLSKPTASVEPKGLLEAKSELRYNFCEDLVSHRAYVKNESGKEQTGGVWLHSSDSEEHSDENHAEVDGTKSIDGRLLSEWDAVGDFHVNETKLEHVGVPPRHLLSDVQHDEVSPHPSISDSQVSGVSSVHGVSTLCLEPKVGSLIWSNDENTELTVYKSKVCALDVCTFEEIDSLLEKLRDHAKEPSASEESADNATLESMKSLRLSEDLEQDETKSEALVAEAVGDINCAPKPTEHSPDHDASQEESEQSGNLIDMDALGKLSDQQDVELRSSPKSPLASTQFPDVSDHHSPDEDGSSKAQSAPGVPLDIELVEARTDGVANSAREQSSELVTGHSSEANYSEDATSSGEGNIHENINLIPEKSSKSEELQEFGDDDDASSTSSSSSDSVSDSVFPM